MTRRSDVEQSSGNVFADLGIAHAEEHQAKAAVALALARAIRERGLTQAEAAEILGLDQPGVSRIVRGQLEKLTLDRLLRYMLRLDFDVLISLRPKPGSRDRAVCRVEGARRAA